MKKVIAIILGILMLSTVAFCLDDTDPNPPKGITPINGTSINR